MVDQAKRKQVSVRLANASFDHLETLKAWFGIRSTTALVAFLIADAVHRLNVKPVQPRASSLSSEVAVEEDEDELDVPRFGRLKASMTRVELDHP